MVAGQTAHKYRQEKDIGILNPIEEMVLNVVQMISLHWRSQAMVKIMVCGTCANLSLMKG